MIYFGQDGCPYCRQLIVTNFSQRRIVEKTRRHFVAIALNLWGDRETTWVDGRARSEKALARFLDVQFTPTLLFLDERGAVVARLNGYYPPHRFEAVLDYVSGKRERRESLGAYLARQTRGHGQCAPGRRAPLLPCRRRTTSGDAPRASRSPCSSTRPIAGRATSCTARVSREEVRALLERFDVVRLPLGARTALTTPDGRATTAQAWAAELDVTFAPTIVFFAADGREVFRVDAYLRPFHLESSLDYVASAAYRDEPSFQRFIQGRAERLRAAGGTVDLWK